ncbi:MAG: O-antigen ligase family protein [Deltaproteobacteria bacterium]|nr:O-antigen ligase family protein [Deltaproteobacteria bacterium]MDQ3298890.1 O-antigen ligase family protein [Myxococcota bacterium]
MFAIPGVACLIVFILARPQEFIPLLQRVPFLHLFTALCGLGWVIDIRLRRLQPIGTPALPWALVFLAWAVISTAIMVPELLLSKGVEMAILFALYGTIAHGVQRFRTFQAVAGVLVATCLFITFVCFHQGLSPTQCVGGQELAGEINGKPDGRECENNERCYGPDAEPGLEYRCEHVGLFGTYSVQGRIRYRGELQDPNEVSLAMTAGALSLLIAFARRKRNPFAVLVCVAGIGLVIATVFLSQSRGGLLSAMLVLGVYVVRRYGVWTMIPAAAAALPVLLFGGRGGASADTSTQLRYEAWATGLDMFKNNPIFGVGLGQFNEHHYLTAHNSFVLTLAELGFIGMFLFTTILYISVKSLILGVRDLGKIPGAEAAHVWGMALLASIAGILFQINTLSFAYHSVLWIFLGLIGAWSGAIRTHMPEFKIRMTWRDVLIVLVGCVGYAFVVLPIFLKYKGEL